MKKIIITLCLFVCLFCVTSCSFTNKDTLHMGVNAVITEIDALNKTITVKDSDKEGVLGENCLINCSKIPIIYCNYTTNEVKDISFDDLKVDDEVILSIRDSQIKLLQSEDNKSKEIKIEQLQLGTQRIE